MHERNKQYPSPEAHERTWPIADFLPCEVDDGEESGGVISVVCDGGVIVGGTLTA